MKARALRRLSRALDAVADRLGRLAALLDVMAEPETVAAAPVPPAPPRCVSCGRAASSDGRECVNCFDDRMFADVGAKRCAFCRSPVGRPRCHFCPGVWRGAA